ncbi:ABC transporter substrate-binding protein [Paenibacillus macerans]|uniref:ABC transporter substrate-binding protein n=1 Tax=Paenibacillus macerans TaxID=44252 RepID=UPI003D31CB7E
MQARKTLRRMLAVSLTAVLTAAVFTACSGSKGESAGSGKEENVTLSVWTQRSGEGAAVLEKVARQFEAENPGIKIDFNAPGNEYENMLKIKMSSDEMPDIWSTHGWAVGKYSDRLADLSGEPWVSRLIPSLKDQVTDKDGRVLAMTIDSDTSALAYNVELFEKYNLEVPKTMDELLALCEKVKTESGGKVTPIHIGGGDSWPIGQAVDYFSTTLLTTDASHNYGEDLKGGTFDWEQYKPLGEFFKTLQEKGYVNKDILTAKNDDTAKAIANNEALIAVTGFGIKDMAQQYNPGVKIGFFPIPSFYETDEPVLIGGETDAWGIWKNTKHMEAAKKFVAYYADPEINKQICEDTSIRSAFADVNADLGDMTPYYEAAKDARIEPYFDRVYFPSGMWDSMSKYGQMLFTDGYSVDQYVKDMGDDYKRLMSK